MCEFLLSRQFWRVGFLFASCWGPSMEGDVVLEGPSWVLFKSVLILLGSKALKTETACMGEAGEPEDKQSIPAAQSLIFEASWFFGGLTHGAGMRWAGSPGPAPWWRGRAAVSSSPAHSPSPLLPNRWAGSSHMFAELGVFRGFFFPPFSFAICFFTKGLLFKF